MPDKYPASGDPDLNPDQRDKRDRGINNVQL